MAGDIKDKYVASSTLTVTSLHSLASSADWSAGWGSASVDNTSNGYTDYLYGGTFTTHASNRQAGQINIYVVASLNDTPTWTSVSSGTLGTQGAIAFVDLEERDSLCRLLCSITVDSTASAVYTFPQTGITHLFGSMPSHHCLFIAQNCTTTTTAGLAASGSAIYYTPKLQQYT